MERIQEYANVEQEPKPISEGVPPAYLPPAGNSLSRTCLPSIAPTDHGPDLHIESGKRAGVVVPTGSGRSLLALVLLRCILTEGNILYDGIPTSKINLGTLRTNITIISPIPESPSDTLRGNSDSFGQHGNAALIGVHRGAGLFSLSRARVTKEGSHRRPPYRVREEAFQSVNVIS